MDDSLEGAKIYPERHVKAYWYGRAKGLAVALYTLDVISFDRFVEISDICIDGAMLQPR